MITFQDFESAPDKREFIVDAIAKHQVDPFTQTALVADLYDRQRNKTINEYVQVIFNLFGQSMEDFTATNNKIASNFFHRLNKQRCTYLLGNGVSFASAERVKQPDGSFAIVDTTKDMLGPKFDTDLSKLCYLGLIHGVSFGFWDYDKLYVFPVTQFVPLWDETTGELRAGIRYWRLDIDKPLIAVLYEEDGYTKYTESENGDLEETQAKKGYKTTIQKTEEGGIISEESGNYSTLPIIPFWGSNLKQSTLVGMQEKIDSFDLIRSGFANDLQDCSQIYWIIENCGGMNEADFAKFRDRLKLHHIAGIQNADNGARAVPYTQDIPFQARKEYLDSIRAGIYEDFGGLDVHTVAAGATNDHIDAAYQPMDEEADDFEYQVIEFIQQLLALMDIEDTPIFKRNRVSNFKEQVEMVALEANWLDEETILRKLPNITPDEIEQILFRKATQEASIITPDTEENEEETEENPEEESESQNEEA